VAAIGLGIWASSLSNSLDQERSARQKVERLLADPTNTRVGVSGTNTGTLFVERDDKATLVVSGLERAPSGRTYEAWVIKDNKPVRAGTFSGGRATTVVPLEREVPSGSIVAVTLEREPGADAPHGKILLHSKSA
jgi:hypothetical protein